MKMTSGTRNVLGGARTESVPKFRRPDERQVGKSVRWREREHWLPLDGATDGNRHTHDARTAPFNLVRKLPPV